MRPLACLSLVIAGSTLASAAFAQSPPPVRGPDPLAAPYAPPPAYWPPGYNPFATEPRSRGMMIAGITLFSVGGVTSTVGTGLFIAAAANPCVYYDSLPGGAIESHPAGRGRTGSARQALSFVRRRGRDRGHGHGPRSRHRAGGSPALRGRHPAPARPPPRRG